MLAPHVEILVEVLGGNPDGLARPPGGRTKTVLAVTFRVFTSSLCPLQQPLQFCRLTVSLEAFSETPVNRPCKKTLPVLGLGDLSPVVKVDGDPRVIEKVEEVGQGILIFADGAQSGKVFHVSVLARAHLERCVPPVSNLHLVSESEQTAGTSPP